MVGDGLGRLFSQTVVGQRSPWCGENRTHWWTGHGVAGGRGPRCEVAPGVWNRSTVPETQLQAGVDRHGCNAEVDVNGDGVPDVICAAGAGKGQGEGENELYITQSNGSLRKVQRADHGLSRFPSMRSRHIAPLRAADGAQLVLVSTQGEPRDDGLPNQHRMFRLQPPQAGREPLFTQEPGPWEMHFDPNGCMHIADLDGNGVDDLLMCDTGKARGSSGTAKIFTQGGDGSWTSWTSPTTQLCSLKNSDYTCNWRSATVADVTGDGVLDVVVTGPGRYVSPHYVRVFSGLASRAPPFFDFSQPYFERLLPHAAADVEVFDANGDGMLDVCKCCRARL